jgi:hypothetical protein
VIQWLSNVSRLSKYVFAINETVSYMGTFVYRYAAQFPGLCVIGESAIATVGIVEKRA